MTTYCYRPILYTRIWSKDPAGVAIRSQEEVGGSDQRLIYYGAPPTPRMTNYDNWPVPKGYKYPHTLYNHEQRKFITPAGVVSYTKRPILLTRIWPKDPAGVAIRAQAAVTTDRPVTLFPAPTAAPIANYDWPVPAQPQRSQDIYSFTAASFFDDSVQPFPNLHWPNPTLAKPYNRYQISGSGPNLDQTGTTAALGFSNLDWPVPKGYIYPSHLRNYTYANNIILNTAPPAPVKSINFDWPVPRGYAHPINLRTFTYNTVNRFLSTDLIGLLIGAPNYDQPRPVLAKQTPPSVFTQVSQQTQGTLFVPPTIPLNPDMLMMVGCSEAE